MNTVDNSGVSQGVSRENSKIYNTRATKTRLRCNGMEEYMRLMIQQQQALFEQLNILLEQAGITYGIDRIILRPRDDDKAVDIVYRIKCRDEEICEKLREAFKQQYGLGEG